MKTLTFEMQEIAQQHANEVLNGERFEFGKNWSAFLTLLNEERILKAEESLREMLEVEDLKGKTFLDIGSGSGLFSLAAKRLGAKVHSFDFDSNSFACTKELKRRFFENDADWTVEQGVPLESIEILQSQVTGTIYEAEVLRKKVEDSNLKSVLLVTSAYHTRRALWIFQKVLAEKNVEIGIEHPPTGEQTPPPFIWWLKINGWELVAGEYVKTLGYWIYY